GLLHDREDLAALGGGALSGTDAELVLAAYERSGRDVIARLRGSFVVAIVDRVRNLAVVARDPVGSHPVFYTQRGARVQISPSQHTCLAEPVASRTRNPTALADNLCQRWPSVEETYFDAIKRVPPGCFLTIGPNGTRIDRHWNRLTDPVDFLSVAEAYRFDEQLARAVRRCFDGGRVGIFLSGGFDSVSGAGGAGGHGTRAGGAR